MSAKRPDANTIVPAKPAPPTRSWWTRLNRPRFAEVARREAARMNQQRLSERAGQIVDEQHVEHTRMKR